MRITSYALPVSLLLLTACPSDDGETETTNSMTSAASTSDASGTAGSSGTTGSATTAGSGSSEGSTAADSTTGSGAEVCATCDPGTEICFASIFDGPTEYSCRPIPEECLEDTSCECVTPLVCPESLQSCAFEGAVLLVECVEG